MAAQLRAEAAAAKLSDKALAQKAGLQYSSLRRWLGKEPGNERNIDVAVLAELAKALGLTPLEVVRRAEERMKVVVDLGARRDASDGADTPEQNDSGQAVAALMGDVDAGEPEEG